MSDKYKLVFPVEFLSDIDNLDKREQEEVFKQVAKIKENPGRFKHLHGTGNCYTVRAGNLRVVYFLEGDTIYFLTAERRKGVYTLYYKRLYNLRRNIS